jgi:hypothetical protein
MSGGVSIPYFPNPPAQYDPRYMSQLVQSFSLFARQVQNATAGLATYAQLTGNNNVWVSASAGTNILTPTYFDFAEFGGFARGTSGDIFVPLTGHYRVVLKLYMGNGDGGRFQIYKNGTSVELLQYSGTTSVTVEVSKLLQMNAGDYIQCIADSFEGPVSFYAGAKHSGASVQFIGT